jgi:hypothetical protein
MAAPGFRSSVLASCTPHDSVTIAREVRENPKFNSKAIALLAGPVAAIPAPSAATLVLFRANTDPADAFAAVAALDARVLWISLAGDLIAFTPAPQSGALRQAWQLYTHGALVVGSTPASSGCLAWTQS